MFLVEISCIDDDYSNPGYAKAYKDVAGKWRYKTTADQATATKFAQEWQAQKCAKSFDVDDFVGICAQVVCK